MRIRNLDDLARMSDDEIRNLLRRTKDEIFNLERNLYREKDSEDFKRLKLLQVEYCYVKRESEIRRERSNAHRQYLRNKVDKNHKRAF